MTNLLQKFKKMRVGRRLAGIIFFAVIILAGFGFADKALASYYTSGTLTSINLLSGKTVLSIDSFDYNASSIPTGTGLEVQFSQNGTTWYNSAGVEGAWDVQSEGSHSISLSVLGWSGPNFYYKEKFTSDGSNTPVLDNIAVVYSGLKTPRVIAKEGCYEFKLDSSSLIGVINNGSDQEVSWSVSTTNWYYAVLTYNGSQLKLFINGNQVDSKNISGSITSNANNLFIGVLDGSENYDGLVDEIRISDTPRSAEWISTTHNNQNSPTNSFYSLSGQESNGWGKALDLDITLKNIITGNLSNPISRVAFLNSGDIEFASFDAINGNLALRETTAPDPTANYGKFYVKSSDSKAYFVDDSGTEFDLTGGGGGAGEWTDGGTFLYPSYNSGQQIIAVGGTSIGTSEVVLDYNGDSWFTGGGVGIGTTGPNALLHVGSLGGPGSVDGVDDLYVYDDLEVDGTIYGDGSGITGIAAAPGGSDGQIQYNNGGNTGGAAQFYYNDGTDWVGIGTDAPNKTLDVQGAVEINLPGAGTAYALCHTTKDGTTNEEIVDCTAKPIADYAEQFPMAENIEYGDLVATGEKLVTTTDGYRVVQLIKSSQPYQANLIGIVSNNYNDFTSAGYNIKEEDNPMPVALVGRLLVKVSLENGPIAIGDLLTSSSQPGVAMKATKAGFTVGRALEPYNNPDPNVVGKIMVFVNLGWYDRGTQIDADGDMAQTNADGAVTKIIAQTVEAKEGAFEKITSTISAIFEKITAKTAEIAEAVIGNLQAVTLNVTGELISPIADIKEINSEQVTTDRLKIREEGETVGEGTILAGETELVIENAEVTENSRIFVTPTTSTDGQALFVSEKKAGESFTISIDKELETDIIFNFWVIN